MDTPYYITIPMTRSAVDQMGRHPFGVALFIAHSDVFFHIPHFKVVRVL
jgi:hypothetical protein